MPATIPTTDKLKEDLEARISSTDDAFEVSSAIVNVAYEHAIPEPEKLDYREHNERSWVYGETSLGQMKSIVDELRVGENDVVVDLGSGVGQLVQFIAGYSPCKKAVGIELLEHRAEAAQNLHEIVTRNAAIVDRQMSPREVFCGSFLEEQHRRLIVEEATVVFINNLVFEPDLATELNEVLLKKMKPGTRIITSAELAPRFRGITVRNANDIGAIIRTTKLATVEGNVSWTGKKQQFYLTVIDHTELDAFKVSCKRTAEPSEEEEEGSEQENAPTAKKTSHGQTQVGLKLSPLPTHNAPTVSPM